MNFQKAKRILGFSFVFGDDFNFFVATNSQIDLYDVSLSKQKAKLVKNISFSVADGHAELFYDSLANVAVICDTQKGTVQPYFLNIYKNRNYKGKVIQLDAEVNKSASSSYAEDAGDGVQGSKAQSTMNAQPSMVGGSSVGQLQGSVKASFGQRALNYFKGTTQTFTNISVAPGVFNKNLKMFMPANDDDNEEYAAEHDAQKKLPRGLNEKRMKHQLFVTSLYNKVILLHLCPHTGEIFIHELDPNVTFKYN